MERLSLGLRMKYTAEKQAYRDGLKFRAADHRYTLQGMVIPSVTTVIEPLEPFGYLPEVIRRAALLRGTLVHGMTEQDDLGILVEDDLLAETGLDGYLHAWREFKRGVDKMVEIEGRVYHTKYRYSGTFDRLALVNGRLSLLEIKTGGLVNAYQLQTAAYQAAINEGFVPQRIDGIVRNQVLDRFVIQLREDGGYSVVQHQDPTDFETFVAALVIRNWKIKYG